MPTPTYDLIASNVLSSSASSVTFSSIPATYRDLIVIAEEDSTNAAGTLELRFNGDTGANYPWVWMRGSGTAASSTTGPGPFIGYTGYNNTSSFNIIHIMDYSATDKHKSYLLRQEIAGFHTVALAGGWANTAAITSITLAATTLASGSTFYLYGIVS